MKWFFSLFLILIATESHANKMIIVSYKKEYLKTAKRVSRILQKEFQIPQGLIQLSRVNQCDIDKKSIWQLCVDENGVRNIHLKKETISKTLTVFKNN